MGVASVGLTSGCAAAVRRREADSVFGRKQTPKSTGLAANGILLTTDGGGRRTRYNVVIQSLLASAGSFDI